MGKRRQDEIVGSLAEVKEQGMNDVSDDGDTDPEVRSVLSSFGMFP
jgi:hypothetical protein